ncbi:hypothetical protein PCV68_001072 [Staphylococcus pseudintermedius]|nr:hypothetical protein [Staphylococcus pseudintermedius]
MDNQIALINELQTTSEQDFKLISKAVKCLKKLKDIQFEFEEDTEFNIISEFSGIGIEHFFIDDMNDNFNVLDEATMDNSLTWYKKMNDALIQKIIKDIDFIRKADDKEVQDYKDKLLNH